MVYDCFTFFNELDLLEIRLNVLSPIVDKFVLVEANKTHSGKEKPFYFDENKECYQKFYDKIIYIKLSNYPEIKTSWTLENYQRNMIIEGLKDCKPDDTVIISDLDELPNPDAIIRYQQKPMNGIYKLKQKICPFYLNYRNITPQWWYAAKIMRYKDILENTVEEYEYKFCDNLIESMNVGSTPNKIRMAINVPVIKNGGWHFTYLGGVENIKDKIKSFSHQEYNTKDYIKDDIIQSRIKNGIDVFGRKGYRFLPVEINSRNLPKYIMENKDKYPLLVYTDINNMKNVIIIIQTILYYGIFNIPFKIIRKILTLLNAA